MRGSIVVSFKIEGTLIWYMLTNVSKSWLLSFNYRKMSANHEETSFLACKSEVASFPSFGPGAPDRPGVNLCLIPRPFVACSQAYMLSEDRDFHFFLHTRLIGKEAKKSIFTRSITSGFGESW